MFHHIRRYSIWSALAIMALVAAPASALSHTAPEPVPASHTPHRAGPPPVRAPGMTEIAFLRYARGLGHEQ